MIEQTSEALRAWFKRAESLCPELFNTAYAICGSYDQAEYALRAAMLEVWSQNADSGMGFREKLRAEVREEAMDALAESRESRAEFNWPGFPAASANPLIAQAAQEPIETQRVLMLRHGVGLSAGRIAQLTGLSVGQARDMLDRFESRCRRLLPAQERGRFDAVFGAAARRQLASRSGVPHPGQVYRGFEAEASKLQISEHKVTRVVYRVVTLLLAMVCAVLFWLFAVLVQPPEIERNAGESAPAAAEESTREGPSPGYSIETTYEYENPA